MSEYIDEASDLYCRNFNCAQAILCAYAPLTGMERDHALLLASSFGGGMGNLKEVCGALTGAFMVLGLMKGFTEAGSDNKRAHGQLVDEMAEDFRKRFDFILCRDLRQRNVDDGSVDTEAKPCLKFVAGACEILEDFLRR